MKEDRRPGAWEYGGWLRKVAALAIAVILLTSVVSVFHQYAGCVTFVILMFIGLVIIIYPPRKRERIRRSRGPGRGDGEPRRAHGAEREPPRHGPLADKGRGGDRAGDGARRRRGKSGGKKNHRRTLRCPECGSTRLVYEAGYMIGQVYLCKDCEYRGSFVIEFDPMEKPEGEVEEQTLEKDLVAGAVGDPHGASPPEEELPEPPGMDDILKGMGGEGGGKES